MTTALCVKANPVWIFGDGRLPDINLTAAFFLHVSIRIIFASHRFCSLRNPDGLMNCYTYAGMIVKEERKEGREGVWLACLHGNIV